MSSRILEMGVAEMFGRRKNNPKRPFGQMFYFENNKQRVADGGWFTPLTDAVGRWSQSFPACFSPLRENFHVVYETKDGDYLEVRYQHCENVNAKGPELWRSAGPPHIQRMSPLDAARFLHFNQLKLPPHLEVIWNEWVAEEQQRRLEILNQPVTIRPFSFWEQQPLVVPVGEPTSHEVEIAKVVDELCNLFAEFLRALDETDFGGDRSGITIQLFIARLFASYPVDVSHWQTHHDEPPPQNLDLLSLDWPAEMEEIRQFLAELRALARGPLTCLYFHWWNLDHSDHPSPEESQAAKEYLRERKGELEALYTSLNRAMRPIRESLKLPARPQPESGDVSKAIAQSMSGEETSVLVTPPERQESERNESTGETVPEVSYEFVDPVDRPLPQLEIVSGGFCINGECFELKGPAWKLFRHVVRQRNLTVRRDEAKVVAWPSEVIEDNTVDAAISRIRAVLREALYLTKDVDPLPQKDRGDNAAWRLGLRFELIDHVKGT